MSVRVVGGIKRKRARYAHSCSNCGGDIVKKRCDRCDLYNAAVTAQQAAAASLATARHGDATNAWLNRYGAFAYVTDREGNHVAKQIATAEEVAPFVALTQLVQGRAEKRLREGFVFSRDRPASFFSRGLSCCACGTAFVVPTSAASP